MTRHLINYKICRVLGFGGEVPQRGEKLICLKNSRGKGLLNGTIWMVEDVGRAAAGFVEMTVVGEEGKRVDVRTPLEGFTVRNGSGLPGDVFAFGYAITCHKAQGSQWGSVAIKDESFYFREHRRHWLYTAITRAADRVSVTP